MDEPEEHRLLRRCRDGESSAWDALFDAHYAALCRFVFQCSSDFTLEDAEEISQEVLVTVIRSLDAFQGECRFQTWLFRIATNKARDYRERQRALKRGGGKVPISLTAPDPETGLILDPPGTSPRPDEQLLTNEKLSLVNQALHRLELRCREVVELRYFGGLGYDEIGRALNLHPKTVSSRLSRCLDRLAPLLRAQFSGEKNPILPV